METESTTAATRRSFVKRLSLFAGAAAAFGLTGRAEAAVDAGAPPTAGHGEPATMRLLGRDFRLASPLGEPGKLPTAGQILVPVGELLDEQLRPVGRFHAAALLGALGRFQLHTFDLPDGSILGLGAGAPELGSFAIIGGTGRYAGASGTYSARQSLPERGGDGSAEFVMSLRAWEA